MPPDGVPHGAVHFAAGAGGSPRAVEGAAAVWATRGGCRVLGLPARVLHTHKRARARRVGGRVNNNTNNKKLLRGPLSSAVCDEPVPPRAVIAKI